MTVGIGLGTIPGAGAEDLDMDGRGPVEIVPAACRGRTGGVAFEGVCDPIGAPNILIPMLPLPLGIRDDEVTLPGTGEPSNRPALLEVDMAKSSHDDVKFSGSRPFIRASRFGRLPVMPLT